MSGMRRVLDDVLDMSFTQFVRARQNGLGYPNNNNQNSPPPQFQQDEPLHDVHQMQPQRQVPRVGMQGPQVSDQMLGVQEPTQLLTEYSQGYTTTTTQISTGLTAVPQVFTQVTVLPRAEDVAMQGYQQPQQTITPLEDVPYVYTRRSQPLQPVLPMQQHIPQQQAFGYMTQDPQQLPQQQGFITQGQTISPLPPVSSRWRMTAREPMMGIQYPQEYTVAQQPRELYPGVS